MSTALSFLSRKKRAVNAVAIVCCALTVGGLLGCNEPVKTASAPQVVTPQVVTPQPDSAPGTPQTSAQASSPAERAAASPPAKPLDEYQASHQRMLQTLQAVDKQSQETHPFLGKRPLKMAEQAVLNSNDKIPVWDRSVMHGIYGQELLRNGRTKEAVAQTKISSN